MKAYIVTATLSDQTRIVAAYQRRPGAEAHKALAERFARTAHNPYDPGNTLGVLPTYDIVSVQFVGEFWQHHIKSLPRIYEGK